MVTAKIRNDLSIILFWPSRLHSYERFATYPTPTPIMQTISFLLVVEASTAISWRSPDCPPFVQSTCIYIHPSTGRPVNRTRRLFINTAL